MVLTFAVIAGLVLGLALGGSLSGISQVRFRYLPVLFVALGIQLAIFTPLAGDWDIVHRIGPYLYISSMVLTLTFLVINRDVSGLKLILLGALLNAIVITANGGYMPADPDGLAEIGRLDDAQVEEAERETGDYVLSNSVIADDDTRLLFLGDVMVVPEPIPLRNVISIGDILIAIGAGYAAFRVTQLQPRRGEATA